MFVSLKKVLILKINDQVSYKKKISVYEIPCVIRLLIFGWTRNIKGFSCDYKKRN